jgi:hypothetical protein
MIVGRGRLSPSGECANPMTTELLWDVLIRLRRTRRDKSVTIARNLCNVSRDS